MKRTALVLSVVIVLAVGLLGATQETKQPLKQEIVKLNYVRPVDVVILLQPYTSREGRITHSPNQNIVSLSDLPENVDKMLAVIKEIDVKPADVVFTVQLVLASEDGAEKTDEALANDPVIKELKSFLKYKSFSFLDTSMVRAISDERSGLTLGRKGEFVLDLKPRMIKKDKADIIQIEVRLSQLVEPYQTNETRTSRSILESNLTVKSGEKTVVGVSRTAGGEKGLILIISAKLVD
jgi:type II secretory pathway component GspD/PulD (secretin)